MNFDAEQSSQLHGSTLFLDKVEGSGFRLGSVPYHVKYLSRIGLSHYDVQG